jgi:uncharacterized protein YjbI with pentapeptide repeats
MQESFLQKLEAAASDKIADLKTLDELKNAAELSSFIAAAKKTNTEANNYTRHLRLESVKSLATFLVPIVSLLTLFATILIQSFQLTQTRQESEDKEWRELLTVIKNSAKEDSPDITIAPRLKSFFGSARLGSQTKAISKRMLGQLTYEPGFRDLFEELFGSVTLANIADTIDIARTLRVTQNTFEARCLNASAEVLGRDDIPTVKSYGLCGTAISETDFSKHVLTLKNSDQIIQLRRTYFEVLKEQVFVRDKIVGVLTEGYKKGTSNQQKLDMSKIHLSGGDLSGIDFSNIDLTGSILSFVRLDGAVLTPLKGATTLQMWGSAWWKAERIDQELLKLAVTQTYPNYIKSLHYPKDDEPERSLYVSRIKALCVPMQAFCEEANLKYGDRN